MVASFARPDRVASIGVLDILPRKLYVLPQARRDPKGRGVVRSLEADVAGRSRSSPVEDRVWQALRDDGRRLSPWTTRPLRVLAPST